MLQSDCVVTYANYPRNLPAKAHAVGDAEGHLQGLLVIQTRVDIAEVGFGQVRLSQPAGPAQTFGHVVAGKFEVYAAEDRPRSLMDFEGQTQLAENFVEAAQSSGPSG